MYLLLSDLQDPLCKAIHASLELGGYEVRVVANPIVHPLRFTWRLDTLSSTSELICEEGARLFQNEIAGVLVRRPGRIAPAGWAPVELSYAQSETEAALLAWLWSLNCPVVNRYPPAVWYLPNAPLLFWRVPLEQCGLRALHSLISNVEAESRVFGANFGDETVYDPLTADARYLLNSASCWDKLAAMQDHAPVHLTQAPVESQGVCVVGPRVVWEGEPPASAETLEPALRDFCAVAGLTFAEITIAFTADGERVAAVYPFPHLEGFSPAAQREIVAGLVQLLTGELSLPQMATEAYSRQGGRHDPRVW